MSENFKTKEMIAQAMIELMQSKSLEAVSIQDIVDKSGFSRRTFYNKFKDKYEVVEWIFTYHHSILKQKFGEYVSWYRYTLEMAKAVKENKTFYSRLFKDRGIIESLAVTTRNSFINAIKRNNDMRDDDERLPRVVFLADFYSHAFMHKLADWVNYGFRETPEELMQLFNLSISDELRRLLKMPEQPDV